MNQIKRVKRIVLLFASLLFALLLWAGITPPLSVSASAVGSYDFKILNFDVEMDVGANREIKVTEKITVMLEGTFSRGIIRDFTFDNGVLYRNITASCNHDDFEYYAQNEENDAGDQMLCVYLRGENIAMGQSRTYTLNYTMIVPALDEEGYLPLDVIGFGWQAEIEQATVILNLPEAIENTNVQIFSGRADTLGNSYATHQLNGKKLTVTATNLPKLNGITVDLKFGEGVLSTSFDLSWLWALLVGAAAIVVAFVAKLLVQKPILTPTVNYTAPDEMDPLRMGKLIDNLVESDDLGALVFYLAEKGYLTIDLSVNENDPILRATGKPLPPDAPNAQKLLYNGLFNGRSEVQISSLRNSFYVTADAIRRSVPGVTGGMYSKKSSTVMGVVLVLTILITGLFAYFYACGTVIQCLAFIILPLACAINAALSMTTSVSADQRRYKWSKKKRIATRLVGIGLGMAFGLIFWLVSPFPFAAFSLPTGIILLLCSGIAGIVCGYLTARTEKYNEVLGQVVGFKNFILYTEKDRIQFMLNDNPEFYYRVLPYAQVLGVTDAWVDKFQDLRMPPPNYMTTNSARGDTIDTMVYCSMYRSFARSMSSYMVSRPSSNGSSGRVSGGFGGGRGGGGFGGGGGRGC